MREKVNKNEKINLRPFQGLSMSILINFKKMKHLVILENLVPNQINIL